MKVLLFNGSANEKGCTYTALMEVARALEGDGIEWELIQLGGGPVRDCIGCGGCMGKNRCVFNDDKVNELLEKCEAADGFVFGSPVYFSHPSGRLLAYMDRMFFSDRAAFEKKPAAAVVSARRSGTTASMDVINKHFTISQMPVVSSTYWNNVHGMEASDVLKDAEGMQTMRNIGHNMAWILKALKAAGDPPRAESGAFTNFVR